MTSTPTTSSSPSDPSPTDASAFAGAVDSQDYDDIATTTWRRHPILMATRMLRRRPPAPARPRTWSRSELLARLRAMPIGTWTYGWEDTEVHHIGPMAQDFWNTFGFGSSDRRIDVGDALGVCMVTICELADRVEALEQRLAEQGADAPTSEARP